MKTVFVIVLYLVVGSVGGWIISKLIDGLGDLVDSLGQPKALTGFWKGLVLACLTLVEAYVFLAWMVFVVSYTKLVTLHQPVVHWLVWIVAFIAAIIPLIFSAGDSTRAEKEDPEIKNSIPSIALNLNCLFDVLIFFLFVFIPILMLYGWPWVPYVREVVQP